MPEPKKNETQKEFVSRCIPIVLEEKTAKDQDQAVAICNQMWRDREKKSVNLDAQTRRVRDAWHLQFDRRVSEVAEATRLWPREIFDDKVIAEAPDGMWSYPYTIGEDEKIEFGEPEKVEIEYKPAKANALKAVRSTDDELIVGNYIVLFGGRDLEGIASPRKNADGSSGQWFTEATKLESAYTTTGQLYVDWEHGRDSDDAPGRDDVLGYVDWSTAKADGKGVWVERALNRHTTYMRFLRQLIDAGILGSSSEPIQEDVEIADDGEIKTWPLKRDALTVAPMEPRMITENCIAAIKGLAEAFPHVKALTDSLEAVTEEGSGEELSATAGGVTVNVHVHTEAAEAAEKPDDQKPTEKAKSTEVQTMSEETKAKAEIDNLLMEIELVEVT